MEEHWPAGLLDFCLVLVVVSVLKRERILAVAIHLCLSTTSVNHCAVNSGRAEGNNTSVLSMDHFKPSPCLIKPGNAWKDSPRHAQGTLNMYAQKFNDRMRVRWR